MKSDIQLKKEYLDYLFYEIGKQEQDIEFSILRKDGEETKSSKWKKFSECIFPIDFNGTCENKEDYLFFKNINQRSILFNEVVLDFEDMSLLDSAVRKLQERKANFHVFKTGSRGFHIHIFFDKALSPQDKTKIITYFGADLQKASQRTMIALEFAPHFKTGKTKERLVDGEERWI